MTKQYFFNLCRARKITKEIEEVLAYYVNAYIDDKVVVTEERAKELL